MTEYYQKHQEERKAYQRMYYRKRLEMERTKLQRQRKQRELQLFAEILL